MSRPFRPLRWAWLLLLAAVLVPAYDLLLPCGFFPPAERRTLIVERGQSLQSIALELQRQGVIRSSVGFLALARVMRLDRRIKAGQYSFVLGTTVPALLRALERGMYGLDLVTVPEGLTLREVAELLERRIGMSASMLDSLARDPVFLDSLGITAPSMEGWLAPDSYEWLPGTSPEMVLRTMVTRTRERMIRATAGCDSLPFGFGLHELLTLASIVEAEAQVDDERPRIARVYLNRIAIGMRLQADPTVGFALGRGPRSRLTFKDLKFESPYNTYLNDGLPPGPICSPGRASIHAAVFAESGVRDLYFVARGDGRHLFARTYPEHLANIEAARALRSVFAARRAAAAAAADSLASIGPASGAPTDLEPAPPADSSSH